MTEQFIIDFAEAVDEEDVDFFLDRLHPLVLQTFEPELCRQFISDEILALDDYRATGDPIGPMTRDQLGEQVADFFEVPVAFSFRGQDFESTAALAILDDEVRWFTQCR